MHKALTILLFCIIQSVFTCNWGQYSHKANNEEQNTIILFDELFQFDTSDYFDLYPDDLFITETRTRYCLNQAFSSEKIPFDLFYPQISKQLTLLLIDLPPPYNF